MAINLISFKRKEKKTQKNRKRFQINVIYEFSLNESENKGNFFIFNNSLSAFSLINDSNKVKKFLSLNLFEFLLISLYFEFLCILNLKHRVS